MDEKFFAYCLEEDIFDAEMLSENPLDAKTCSYEMLIQQGYVSQERLAIAAGTFYHCPVVDLSRVTPEVEATRYGSSTACRNLGFLPFAVDPIVGVVIAVADYTQSEEITSYLKDMNVERVKFYIAPYESLMQMIERLYGPESGTFSSVLGRNRRLTLRAQCIDFDSKSEEKDKRIELLEREIVAGRESIQILRRQVEKLETQLARDEALLEQMAGLLCAQGIMDEELLQQWRSSE